MAFSETLDGRAPVSGSEMVSAAGAGFNVGYPYSSAGGDGVPPPPSLTGQWLLAGLARTRRVVVVVVTANDKRVSNFRISPPDLAISP